MYVFHNAFARCFVRFTFRKTALRNIIVIRQLWDYGGSTNHVDRWAQSGVAIQYDAWHSMAVTQRLQVKKSHQLHLMARTLSFSSVSLWRFFWGRVPPVWGWMTVFVSKPLCCLPGIPSECSSYKSFRAFIPACRRLCIEVGDNLFLCTLWPVYHAAGLLECVHPPSDVRAQAIVRGVCGVRYT